MSLDRSTLTPSQTAALNQLRDLTNGGDDEVTIGVLESVDWDVQRAAEMIFGTGMNIPPPADSSFSNSADLHDLEHLNNFETFEVDDSGQGDEREGLIRERNNRGQNQPLLVTILAYPLHIITSLFRFLFTLLRIPLRFLPLPFLQPQPQSGFNLLTWWYRTPNSARGSSSWSSANAGTGTGGVERWIRELEEETGAICLGRTGPVGTSTSTSVGIGSSASNLTSRTAGPSTSTASPDADIDDSELDALLGSEDEDENDGARQRFLPSFQLGSYEHALKVIEKEARIGCIILVSEEHDDVAEFKRTTLTSPAFLRILHKNNMYVWGGDVRDKEAWSAAKKIGCTSFPFVAFVALQPTRTFNSSSSSSNGRSSPPSLTILSRHTTLSETTPTKLVHHLNTTLLPRILPYLSQIRTLRAQLESSQAAQRQVMENERRIREEQDRAFEETRRRDAERIRRKVREEEEEKRRKEEEEVKERQRVIKEEREREEREYLRGVLGRGYGILGGKSTNTIQGGVGGDGEGKLRIAVRMPDGKRLVRKFKGAGEGAGEGETVGKLFAWVDLNLNPPAASSSSSRDPEDPESLVESAIASKAANTGLERALNEWWGFTLSTSYPRRPIPWKRDLPLSQVDGLSGGGGQVIVELVSSANGSRRSLDKGKGKEVNGDDHDGYITESSDEE
ncbi:UBX domain-containing protein 10 [Stygiomarasmius scandens]|uniref:UBX domain-containing protein 10 n=1 Tax=Marasmiellus scandens TaxID=2682957 RepID=A0ABR1JFL9_9AGAR